MEGKISELNSEFKCIKCGGNLKYDPEVSSLKCPFCGMTNKISTKNREIKEENYKKFLEEMEKNETYIEKKTAECDSCGSEFSVEPEILSTECPFCATPIVLQEKISKIIKPKAIHPFKISKKTARKKFRQWIKKRWFLPSDMKKMALTEEKISGVYLPYWTFDANSMSYYSGERGDEKSSTESFTVIENGEKVTKRREAKYIDWNYASGVLYFPFNDVLVPAGNSLPKKFNALIKPWKLNDLSPFSEEYLSGFRGELYVIGVKEGFETAKDKMVAKIRDLIRKDIGGDRQKIHTVKSSFDNISFKHILLPVWMSSYRYKKKVFRFIVNGVTGELQGDRPWSWGKISLLILSIAALVVILIVVL